MKKIIFAGIFIITALSLAAMPIEKKIFIKVFSPENAWTDSQIESKIAKSFSSQSNIIVQMIDNDNNAEPKFPKNYFNSDLLIEWGKESGGRYVMIVDIQSERIEKRKSFHLPLIFHKYQTYGIIEGEFRIFDVERGKLLSVKTFKVEEKGARIFQATMDDDINDPDLHITAPAKIKFFSKLEDKLVAELKKKTKVYFGLR